MRVLGLMSGTSADGIDVALVRVTGRGRNLRTRLERFCTFPYPAAVRSAVLRVANANRQPIVSVAEISQLHFLLGELYAEAVQRACRRFRVSLKRIDLSGCHGQTVYHQPRSERFAGRRVASTLQLGEAQVLAERTGQPVVANFRPRDLAAGGQGAPLVPFVDYLLYRHPQRGRVALNIGGIANVTVIPAGARPEQVIAFDTGPGNMVIDAVVERLTRGRQRFDRNGRLAASGRPNKGAVKSMLNHWFFRRPPPKSCGREQFGASFASWFLMGRRDRKAVDRIRTVTEYTIGSIVYAFKRFILPHSRIDEVIVSGGGARNDFLMRRLQEELPGLRFLPAGKLGVDEKAGEALAAEDFADVGFADGAFAEDAPSIAAQIHHRRSQQGLRLAAIEDERQAVADLFHHLGGIGAGGEAGEVGAGAGDGRAQGGNHRAGNLRVRQAQGDAAGAAGHLEGHARRGFDHDRQRSRPEALRQLEEGVRQLGDELAALLHGGDENGQGAALGPAFDFIDAGYGREIERVGGQPVESVGGNADHLAPPDELDGALDGARLRAVG